MRPEESAASTLRKRVVEAGLEQALRETVTKLFPEISEPFEGVSKVLCVQPHPDDCDLGAGGTLADLAGRGVEVVYLTMTDGSRGTTDPAMEQERLAEIRRREQEEAGRVIGVSRILWLGYPDTLLPYTPEVRERVLRVIREEKPDVVFAPDPWLMYEAHPDHRVTGLVASEAVMFSPLPLIAREVHPHVVAVVAYYYTARPNYFHDVSGTFNRKLEALSRHKSQFESVWPIVVEQLKVLAAAYGAVKGVEFAEAFRVLPFSLIHAVPLSEIV
ncbi:PIG-L family deacetylase [Infirmifilum lucidum]|uniref:PIG-L family deacetylase n=1 Tax=Infirmifilum lucidum TaxID=2776706 RepID=A0A7L9FGF8_9CREN|nr:PIG-L deacetylase family protein [Infirmifilum lucidum]QOJ78880.1 PIG-L family deacetylase [Infirmifilum lucidum]